MFGYRQVWIRVAVRGRWAAASGKPKSCPVAAACDGFNILSKKTFIHSFGGGNGGGFAAIRGQSRRQCQRLGQRLPQGHCGGDNDAEPHPYQKAEITIAINEKKTRIARSEKALEALQSKFQVRIISHRNLCRVRRDELAHQLKAAAAAGLCSVS